MPPGALDLARYLDGCKWEMLHAIADAVQAASNDHLFLLNQNLLRYASDTRGRAKHTADEIKRTFAPKLEMRMCDWNAKLKQLCVPYLAGKRGRASPNYGKKTAGSK
jgi:hypothetical protein